MVLMMARDWRPTDYRKQLDDGRKHNAVRAVSYDISGCSSTSVWVRETGTGQRGVFESVFGRWGERWKTEVAWNKSVRRRAGHRQDEARDTRV